MPNELIVYILIVIIAGLLSSLLSFFSYFRLKDAPGARLFMLVTLFSAVFTFSYAFELASTSLEQMKFWLNVEYLFMPFIPAFVLLMCIEYVGQKPKQWLYYVLFSFPIVTIFMHGTNELHHLYYKSIQINNDSPYPILMLEHGPWFYVHSIFLFLCLMSGVITLLMQLKKTKLFQFRMQIILMVAGIIFPIIANYFYINGMSPYGLDLGPVSMSVSFIFHGAALLSYQMFNVTPIARDTVFENMKDGVVVLNQNDRIVDYNSALLEAIPTLNAQVIGKSIFDVVDRTGLLAEIILLEKECDYKCCKAGKNAFYNIRFSTVRNKNNYDIGKIITFVDVTERVNLQEKLEILASMDGLTQVYNRNFFMQESERTIESLILNGGNVSIIMFDIDHFKQVNDTFGHEVGDMVLTGISRVVKDSLRTDDIMGRYGGEEFIICLPNTSLIAAYELAQVIRMKIFQTVMPYDQVDIRVSSSFGISSTSTDNGDASQTLQTLMREADQALYSAKRKGRNYVELYKHDFEVIG